MDRTGGSDDVFLIGCSRSVLDLTPEEVRHVNGARCALGLNKFVYFRGLVGIRPTHVWFADDHPPAPRILFDIMRACYADRLRGVTFVLGRGYEAAIRAGAARYALARVRRRIRLDRRRNWRLIPAPLGCRFEYVSQQHWLEGGRWATRPGEPLYHLRTAFTSALNYLAVAYPGATIRLVGADFNSPGYFFDEEMRRLGLPWDDWTTAMQAEHGTHTAMIPYRDITVFDGFAYMREQLDRAGIRLTCNNPGSELVLRGLAEYAPILETPAGAPRG